jgi:hypothetical protein
MYVYCICQFAMYCDGVERRAHRLKTLSMARAEPCDEDGIIAQQNERYPRRSRREFQILRSADALAAWFSFRLLSHSRLSFFALRPR